METTQPPIQWVAKQLGEESVELNLHPHTPSLRAQGLYFISFYAVRGLEIAVGTATRLRAGRSGFRNPEEAINFSILQKDLTGCGVHRGPGFFPGGIVAGA